MILFIYYLDFINRGYLKACLISNAEGLFLYYL